MKQILKVVSVMVVASLLLGACTLGPGAAGVNATEPPVDATQPPATEPGATQEGGVPPTLETIDLAGPPMEVGSKFAYIDGSILAAVPGGPFVMGYSSFGDSAEHEVNLSDFWIYSTEVTNQQYALCVNAGKCTAPDPEDNPNYGNYRFVSYPVTGVNHTQATDYCAFVHGRLPTEAEWEKAARGPESNLFPWGNEGPVCDLLNFNFCKGKAVNVKSYPDGVSYYGVFDMAGNIREWVGDWYKNDYFSESPSDDPLGPELGSKRSVRSSSFADSADFAISAHRFSLSPADTLPDLGFRCVVGDPTFFAPLCTQLAYIGTGPTGEEADCTPDVYCNDVGVSVAQLQCSPGDPSAFSIVSFSVDAPPYADHTKNAPGCVAGPGAMQFTCQSGVAGSPATISGQCYDTASCDPVCPAHYNLVGDTCQWDGTGTIGGECIAGMTYDPVNQCCAATPGSAVDFAVCPAGSHPMGGICVPDLAPVADSASAPITFDSCNPPQTGDDDSGGPCPPPQTQVCVGPPGYQTCYCV